LLVDLAGSENLKKVTASNRGEEDLRQRQAIGINKALATLGTVVHGLNAGMSAHVRNSVLTMLLKECLGGNSRALMIANVSPEIKHMEETLKTLTFATAMAKVHTAPKVNTVKADPRSELTTLDIRRRDPRDSPAMQASLEARREEVAVPECTPHWDELVMSKREAVESFVGIKTCIEQSAAAQGDRLAAIEESIRIMHGMLQSQSRKTTPRVGGHEAADIHVLRETVGKLRLETTRLRRSCLAPSGTGSGGGDADELACYEALEEAIRDTEALRDEAEADRDAAIARYHKEQEEWQAKNRELELQVEALRSQNLGDSQRSRRRSGGVVDVEEDRAPLHTALLARVELLEQKARRAEEARDLAEERLARSVPRSPGRLSAEKGESYWRNQVEALRSTHREQLEAKDREIAELRAATNMGGDHELIEQLRDQIARLEHRIGESNASTPVQLGSKWGRGTPDGRLAFAADCGGGRAASVETGDRRRRPLALSNR